MRDLDLKRRLELAGLEVIEVDGWTTRGSETFAPNGSVNHHTAGPRTGYAPSLGICINGRSDLPGPLCNTYGAREESLRVHLVAAGRANHAGRGGWRGLVGNSSVYGHEEEHCGYPDEPLSEVRLDRLVRVHAAFAYGRFGPEMVCQHHEWTTRKIDFQRALVDPVEFRLRVHRRLLAMQTPVPAPEPEPLFQEQDDMIIRRKARPTQHLLIAGGTCFVAHDKDSIPWAFPKEGAQVVDVETVLWNAIVNHFKSLDRFVQV